MGAAIDPEAYGEREVLDVRGSRYPFEVSQCSSAKPPAVSRALSKFAFRFLLSSVVSLALGLGLASSCGRAADIKVVNVMPAFEKAWRLGLGKPLDVRVRLMKQIVFIPNEPAYDDYGQIPLDDVHIAWFLHDVAPIMPQIRAYEEDLRRTLPVVMRQFRGTFPDFDQKGAIYFMPSLFVFDGQSSDGVLRFGLDGIVKYDEKDVNLGVLVSHELFHVYHAQVQAKVGARPTGDFWESLWAEGLATYVSFRLNPESTESEVLHEKTLAELSPADVMKMACAIAPVLDKPKDAGAQFLDTGASPTGLPPRGAYLIGLLVAAKIAAVTPDLRGLAALHGDELHATIASDVAGICAQAPPPPTH
jgi:hypothetical protein